MTHIPDYADLRRIDAMRANCSWGVFGADDQRGTLNFITPDVLVAAREEIVRGAAFGLSLPLEVPGGGFAGRAPLRHDILQPDRNSQDDILNDFSLQGSSQWDGLRHMRAREFGFYNDTTAEQAGPDGDRLGIEHWASTGIIGRAVLVDVQRVYEADPAYSALEVVPITVGMLEHALDVQAVTLLPGDVLLVRTGFLQAYLSADADGRAGIRADRRNAGLSADEDMARFLWDHKVAAVAADNPALEWEPGDPADGFLHRRLIPMLGYPYGEWFDLEALAADCADDHRYTSFFASVPLNLTGGVGSPANAVALK